MDDSDPTEIIFTREQFYEKLWSIPTTKVAEELGCSDVMICKICKAYDVPKPYAEHWAQLAYKKEPLKTPLPENADPKLQVLKFIKHPEGMATEQMPEPEPEYDADIGDMLDKARELEPLTVADSLRNPHPLIAVTRDRLKIDRKRFYEQTEQERNDRRPRLDVSVSSEHESRALRIMDALIKRWETLGGTIELKNVRGYEYYTHTVICLAKEDVCRLRLRERQQQVRVPADKKRNSWDRDIELRPTGILVLDEGPSYSEWILLKDTPKHRRIEEGLNDLVIRLIKRAGDERIARRQEELERKRREEEDRIREQQEEELRKRKAELKQRQQTEQARVDELQRQANAWRQSTIIRDYLDAVSEMLVKQNGEIASDSDAAEYLRWAHDQANRLDPLVPSPPSVLDQRIE